MQFFSLNMLFHGLFADPLYVWISKIFCAKIHLLCDAIWEMPCNM